MNKLAFRKVIREAADQSIADILAKHPDFEIGDGTPDAQAQGAQMVASILQAYAQGKRVKLAGALAEDADSWAHAIAYHVVEEGLSLADAIAKAGEYRRAVVSLAAAEEEEENAEDGGSTEEAVEERGDVLSTALAAASGEVDPEILEVVAEMEKELETTADDEGAADEAADAEADGEQNDEDETWRQIANDLFDAAEEKGDEAEDEGEKDELSAESCNAVASADEGEEVEAADEGTEKDAAAHADRIQKVAAKLPDIDPDMVAAAEYLGLLPPLLSDEEEALLSEDEKQAVMKLRIAEAALGHDKPERTLRDPSNVPMGGGELRMAPHGEDSYKETMTLDGEDPEAREAAESLNTLEVPADGAVLNTPSETGYKEKGRFDEGAEWDESYEADTLEVPRAPEPEAELNKPEIPTQVPDLAKQTLTVVSSDQALSEEDERFFVRVGAVLSELRRIGVLKTDEDVEAWRQQLRNLPRQMALKQLEQLAAMHKQLAVRLAAIQAESKKTADGAQTLVQLATQETLFSVPDDDQAVDALKGDLQVVPGVTLEEARRMLSEGQE